MMYVYKCPRCDTERELKRPIARRDDPVQCIRCAGERYAIPMRRQLARGIAIVTRGGQFVGSPSKWLEIAEAMPPTDEMPLVDGAT